MDCQRCDGGAKPQSNSKRSEKFKEISLHLRKRLDSLRQDLIENNFEIRTSLLISNLEPNEKQQVVHRSQLAQIEHNKKNNIEKFMLKQCPICLEYLCILGWQNLLIWPCGHLYCELCSNRLVSNEPIMSTCSVCRKIVETNAIHRIF
jgi:hypothetical protein